MEYVKVESSLIAEVGFGDGLYGPETLGIKFPPNKKQREAGELESEYHYGGLTPEKHQEFMAAKSIGLYFARNIKCRADLYPFTKVEANPTAPTAEPFSATNFVPVIGNDDTPSPGSALALIDNLKPEFVFVPGNMDSILSQIRTQALEMVKGMDISTPKMRKAIKDVKNLVVKSRTYIERMRVGYVSAEKRRLATVDGEGKRIREFFEMVEDEVLTVTGLTAWEQEEDARTTRLSGRVAFFANMGQVHLYTDAAMLETAIAELEEIDTSTMQEYKVSAESAIAASLKVLKPQLAAREKAEADAKELEALRAAAAKRAEDDRIAAAAKKLADDKIAAAVEAAKVETRQEVVQEMTNRIVETQGVNALVPLITGLPTAPVEDVQTYEYLKAPSTGTQHRANVQDEIIMAMVEHTEATRDIAVTVIEAISKGLIPHVTINY